MKTFLSKLDGSRDVGFLTPRILGIIVAFAVVVSAVSWVQADKRPTVPLHAMVFISSTTAPGVVDVRTCETISDRFRIDISSDGEDSIQVGLENGQKESDGACFFSIKTDIVKASAYTLSLNDRLDLAQASVHETHENALETAGYEHLVIVADW